MRVAACLRSVPCSSARRLRIGSRRFQRMRLAILRYNAPMRRFLLVFCLLGCSEWRLRPTFPEQAAHRPVVHEQALLGLAQDGDAAVAQLIDADGEEPQLALLIFDRNGGPSRQDLAASAAVARAVSDEVHTGGHQRVPVLPAALTARWPP